MILAGGAKALKFLEPVEHKDHLGRGLSRSFIGLHHQEFPAVEGDVPTAVRSASQVFRLLEQKPRFAGGDA